VPRSRGRRRKDEDWPLDLALADFDSKLLGTGCAIFHEHVRIYTQEGETHETVSVRLTDIRAARAIKWAGLQAATLVIEKKDALPLEVPLLAPDQAIAAVNLIQSLLAHRVVSTQAS
jgi:hypothetical protein